MTHLYIELNTGLTEEVNSLIIEKLYNIASSGDLDETSDLKGRLHSTLGFENEVAYLNNTFTDLFITVDTAYISFADTEINRIFASMYGDGIGVTSTDIQNTVLRFTSSVKNAFNNNTNIKILDLRHFVRLTSDTGIDLNNITINGLTALQKIYLKNVFGNVSIRFAGYPIGVTTLYKSIITPYVQEFIIDGLFKDQNPSSSTLTILGGAAANSNETLAFGIVAVRNLPEKNSSNNDITYTIGSYTTRYVWINKLYLDHSTVIKFGSGYGDDVNRISEIYVPTSLVSAYQNESTWSSWTGTFVGYDFENDPDGIFSMMN